MESGEVATAAAPVDVELLTAATVERVRWPCQLTRSVSLRRPSLRRKVFPGPSLVNAVIIEFVVTAHRPHYLSDVSSPVTGASVYDLRALYP